MTGIPGFAGPAVGADTPFAESWLSRYTPYVLLLVYLYYCTEITLGIFDEYDPFAATPNGEKQ